MRRMMPWSGFLFLMCLALGMRAYSAPLKIEIRSEQKSVKNGDFFPVTTVVTNAGKGAQILHVMNCSYDDHWITDSPFAHVQGISCDKNFLEDVALQPGEAFKRNLSIRIAVPAEKLSMKAIRFRLGFRNGNEGGNNGMVLAEPAWSNLLTINVGK